MAKKKVTRKKSVVDYLKAKGQGDAVSRHASMEGGEVEKLQNLRSLNALLLEDIVEKRQQVVSLVKAKEALEAELTRASEESVRMEVEMSLFREMVDGLVREKCKADDTEVEGSEGFLKDMSENYESEIQILEHENQRLVLDDRSRDGEVEEMSMEEIQMKIELDKEATEFNETLREKARLFFTEKSSGTESFDDFGNGDDEFEPFLKGPEIIEKISFWTLVWPLAVFFAVLSIAFGLGLV